MPDAPYFQTADQWVGFFEEKFPKGVLVTFARGDYKVAQADLSPQSLGTHFGIDLFDEYAPRMFFSDYDTGHPRFFTPEEFISMDPNRMVILLDNGAYMVLSDQVSEEQAAQVEARRKGGFFS